MGNQAFNVSIFRGKFYNQIIEADFNSIALWCITLWYECSPLFVFMWVQVWMCICACKWRPEDMLGFNFSSAPFICFFEAGSLPALKLTVWLKMANKPWCFLQVCTTIPECLLFVASGNGTQVSMLVRWALGLLSYGTRWGKPLLTLQRGFSLLRFKACIIHMNELFCAV